ncbi:DUF3368 domain-containing protein [Deferrisoma sp.]
MGSPSASVWVLDANVLIDLHRGGVLDAVFRLGVSLAAPDVVVAELRVPDGAALLGMGLASLELSPEQVREVAELIPRYPGASTNDIFALVLAKALAAPLLTGDRHLRRAAEDQGVAVHGTLWLLDEMVRAGVIRKSQAANALTRMLAHGRRLPKGECERRLRAWAR